MTDYNDDEANLDDLIDYNDFDDNDLESGDGDDFFDDDIQKCYEDHKKNINAKGSEASNAQRPVSSYHRVVVPTKEELRTSGEREREKEKEANVDYQGDNREGINDKFKSPNEEQENAYDDFVDEADYYNYSNDQFHNSKSQNQNYELNEYNNTQGKDNNTRNKLIDDSLPNNKELGGLNNNLDFVNNYPNNNPVNFSSDLNNFDDLNVEAPPDLNVEYTYTQYEGLVNRLNSFLRTKILKTEFCDNYDLFVNFEDFCSLFKKIRFDAKQNDLKILFSHLNPHKDEGYIKISNFISSNGLQFKHIVIDSTSEDYSMKKVNDEFNFMHNEILEIIRKDIVDQKLGRDLNSSNKVFYMKDRQVTSACGSGKSKISNRLMSATTAFSKKSDVTKSRPLTSLIPNENNMSKSVTKEKMVVSKFLEKTIKKKNEEEKIISQTYEKRRKEFENDCLIKMEEANRMCCELNIKKIFTPVKGKKGVFKCQVLETNKLKDENNPHVIELKAFVIQWRILYKNFIQQSFENNKLDRFTQNPTKQLKRPSSPARNNSPFSKNNLIKMDKVEIKKQIKKLLISSMKLKMKLKSQVTSLKKNYQIDENVILSHLSQTLKMDN